LYPFVKNAKYPLFLIGITGS